MIKEMLKNLLLFQSDEKTRKKWVKKQLSQLKGGSDILDAGCGSQQYKKYCTHLSYYAQDFAKYNGKGDGTGLQTGE